MSDGVVQEERNGVTWLRLDRPPVNTLDLPAWTAITSALRRAAEESPYPVVITGTGRAFSAGDDITEFSALRKDRAFAETFFLEGLFGTFTAVVEHPTPVIAAVNGLAYGGGLELVAACDLAVAVESATFCIPEGRLGAFAGGFAGLAPTLLPYKAANDFALRMARFGAEDARRLGLISTVVPEDALNIEVERMVVEMTRASPGSLVATKRFLASRAREEGLPRMYEALRLFVDHYLSSPEVAEGEAAFLGKREPDFGWPRPTPQTG